MPLRTKNDFASKRLAHAMPTGCCSSALRALLATLLTFLSSPDLLSGDTKPSFSKDIQPILAQHCYACHGADENSREADLRLDNRETAIEMGAITPEDPEASGLISRIYSDDEDLLMPPADANKPLSDAQKQLLKTWIAGGAIYEEHWSFERPIKPAPPTVHHVDWCQNDIDRFVLARLEAAGLKPAPTAKPNVLFRRLCLDITGLPPSVDELSQFLKDYRQDSQIAISKWIDRLMKRPSWGEHRARYWLDAARYADTHGLHFDNYREMWAYRDWVIRSFNQNQPFDEFTVDQLAGDLRSQPTQDQLIATGFQRCNITTNEGGTIEEENLAIYASDRVQTFGWVYLGLTTNCCQCHDHKFDPLTMRDYYSLAAYFRNTTQGGLDGNAKDGKGPVIKVYAPEDEARLAAIESQSSELKNQEEHRRNNARQDFANWRKSVTPEDFDIPKEDLAFHLPLDDAKGSLLRRAQSKQPIEVNKHIDWNVDGVIGKAFQINKDNVPIIGDFGDVDLDDTFSFACFVRSNNTQGGLPIFARMNESDGYRGWDLFREGDEFVAHLIDSWPGNAWKIKTTSAAVKSSTWQHVVVTYDGKRQVEGVRIFVDGAAQPIRVLTNTLAQGASIRTDVPLKLGQRSQGGVFSGSLQDLRIYSSELSDDQARALAHNTPLLTLLERTESDETSEEAIYDYYLANVDDVSRSLKSKRDKLRFERDAIEDKTPVTHVQREKVDSPAMAHILMRGAYDKKGEKVTAATPRALHSLPNDSEPNRMGLAKWVVDSSNPLTARVTVNRFWQELFGQGIVSTPEDFGLMGAAPTHPQLLDWLAVEFHESGWDVQHLFKLMLSSATYQQSAATSPKKESVDRDNTLLSRGPRFRMDAEMIRDYALSASGLLSKSMYGPGTRPYQPDNLWNVVGLPGGDTRNYVQDKGENLYRRSIYTFWKRMSPPPNLEAFNAPSREVCVVRRERTNTPLQALVTLNDPQYVEAARRLAELALKTEVEFQDRVSVVSLRTLARELTREELLILHLSFEDLNHYYKHHAGDAKALVSVGQTARDDSLDITELATWTMLTNQLMNLDEVFKK